MKRLPAPPTSLIGRARDIEELADRVIGGARLVTLVGLGGVGKSRLALATAAALDARGVPVAYVEGLGAASEVELAVSVADRCEVALDPGVEPLAALADALSRLPAHVIVLDDLEHLAAVAGRMLERLLAYAPTTSVIVTSRVPFGGAVERVVGVQPLACAGPASPAAALLLDRAGHAPSWSAAPDAVARLASRLDGMPLALELAAAHARAVTPGELLALLDADEAPGARGLDDPRASRDAAVRWAWDGLDPPARRALTALCAIGSFDLDGAAAALAVSPARALADVEGLVDLSLLIAEATPRGTRYRVLDTVSEFATRHGDPAVQSAAWDAFADALVARSGSGLDIHALWPDAQLERVFADREHHLACARRALAAPTAASVTRALRAATVALPAFLRMRTPLAMGRPFVDLLLHPTATLAPAPLRVAAALAAIAFVTRQQGAVTLAGELLERATAWSGDVDDPRLRLERIRQGWDAIVRWRLRGAAVDPGLRRLADQLDESAWIRVVAYEVVTRRNLGQARLGVDDALLAEAIHRAQAGGAAGLVAMCRTNLAYLCHNLGAPDEALRQVAFGLAAGDSARHETGRHYLVRERGRAHIELGRLADAAADFAEAIAAFHGTRAEREATETTLDAVGLALERGALAHAEDELQRVAGALETPFDHLYHHALAAASAALAGRASRSPEAPAMATGSVEDLTFAVWRSVADAADPAAAAAVVAQVAHGRGHSYRLRQALRVLEATSGLAPAILVSLDDLAFRVGGVWVSLDHKPALRLLWRALVTARLATRGEGVTKDALTALLWPGERLSAQQRDNRLHVNITTLRKTGVGDLLQAHDGGYRLDPERLLVRVSRVRSGQLPSGKAST